jgi:hypothetical protein
MPDVETTQGINCSICKNTLFEEESIGFEGARICAACKPGYFQKLREGVMPTQAFRSTFFARLIALCLHGSWCSALAAVITWSALQINPKMPDRVSLPLMVILSAVAAVATLYFCRGRLRTRIWRLPGDLILPAVALFIALFVSGFTGLISLAVYYETNKINRIMLLKSLLQCSRLFQ